MSRRLLLSLACMLCVPALPAEASILSSYLTFDGPVHHTFPPSRGGGEDFLRGNALSAFVDRGAPGFDQGDVVWGIVKFTAIEPSGLAGPSLPLSHQIAIVFSARVDALTPVGIALAPIGDAADPFDLRNLLDGSVQSGLGDHTLATILSSGPAQGAEDDPLNWKAAQVSDSATGFSAANGWEWELTADLLPGTSNFYHFVPTGFLSGIDVTALTISSSSFPANWLAVDVVDFAGVIHTGHLTLDRGSLGPASAAQQANGWTFTDESSFFVNAAPEPASLGVFGALSLAAMVCRRRPKKSVDR